MPSPADESLGDLIEQALERELIDHCYVTKEAVTLSVGGKSLAFDRDEGRRFLGFLLYGWSRQQQTEGKATSSQPKRSRPAAFAIPGISLHGIEVLPEWKRKPRWEESECSSDAEGASPGQPYADLLGSALSFAKCISVLKEYTEDRQTNTVLLKTEATTVDLPHRQALEYVLYGILEELRGYSVD